MRPPWLRPGKAPALSVSGDHSEIIEKVQSRDELVAAVMSIVPRCVHFRRDENVKHALVLDQLCIKLDEVIDDLCSQDKVKILCAFGELISPDIKHRRVPQRYFQRPLLFRHNVLTRVVEQLPPAAVPREAVIPVMRAVSRMNIPTRFEWLGKLAKIEGERIQKGGVEVNPAELTEIALILSRGGILSREDGGVFLQVASEEIDMHWQRFSEDQIGDFARALCRLSAPQVTFTTALSRELPLQSHDLAWWNVVDLLEYSRIAQDKVIFTRLSNDLWKWLPQLSGEYAARAISAVSHFSTSDRRTVLGLMRIVQKKISSLSPSLAADTLISAAKLGYHPRHRYGRKAGELLYKRLAVRICGAKMPGDVLVSVAEALDSIKHDEPQLWREIDQATTQGDFSLDEVARLAATSSGWPQCGVDGYDARELQHCQPDSVAAVASFAPEGQLKSAAIGMLATSNMSDCSPQAMLHIIKSIAHRDHPLITPWLRDVLFNGRANKVGVPDVLWELGRLEVELKVGEKALLKAAVSAEVTSNTKRLEMSASLCVLGMDWIWLLPSVSQWNGCSTDIALLLSVEMRYTNWTERMPEAVACFLSWVEPTLSSKAPVGSVETSNLWHCPAGAHRSIRCGPIMIPIALLSHDVSISEFYNLKTALHVKQALAGRQLGVAILPEEPPTVLTILKTSALIKMGWIVRFVPPNLRNDKAAVCASLVM